MDSASSRPFVKICGVTTAADVLACANCGVDWIGLNFHPPSSRFVSIDLARSLVEGLPTTLEAVGVFVDQSAEDIRRTAKRVGLKIVQLHGQEPPETVRSLRSIVRVVKAFRIEDASSLGNVKTFVETCLALDAPLEAILIDSPRPGTGTRIDEKLIVDYVEFPRLILAGGLRPENVRERIERFRPWMVDVAGGVESAPGRKDPSLIASFVRAAKNARC